MIFVCLGSREYQFNRLLKKLDDLVECGALAETIVSQIGQSTYLPKHYSYKRFMPVDEFKKNQHDADLIISHGGTGALIGALKMGKKVLAVPRLAKYGEHIDDHQMQIVEALSKEGYVKAVLCMDDLLEGINLMVKHNIKKYSQPSYVLKIIENFIRSK